jgi:outer membrane protein assembly factor BamB
LKIGFDLEPKVAAARPASVGHALLVWVLLLLARAASGVETLTNEWSVDIRCPSDSSAALGNDGTVYFGTWDGKLWALGSDGPTKWTFRTGREIRSSPAIALDGTIYVGSRDRKLYAVRPDGGKKWEFPTGAWVDASPAVAADGTVYVGSWDKTFYALDANGSKKWQFQTGGVIDSSAAIDAHGRVYFGSHDQRLYALEPDGKKAWDYTTAGPILSSPALDREGEVVFTSVDGNLYALQSNGSLKWRLQTGGVSASSPVFAADGKIYIGVNDHLWAVSSEGKKLWEQATDDPQFFIEASPAALADGSVVYSSRYALLTDLGPDQKQKWNVYLYAYGFGSPNFGPTGTVFTYGEWTNFYAFRGSVPLAQSPWPKFRGDTRNSGNVRTER